MAHPHYGSDKMLLGLILLIVLSLLALWFWGNRADTAPKQPLHTEPSKHTSLVPSGSMLVSLCC